MKHTIAQAIIFSLLSLACCPANSQSPTAYVPLGQKLGAAEAEMQWRKEFEHLSLVDSQFIDKLSELAKTDKSASDLEYNLRPALTDRLKRPAFQVDYRWNDQLRCVLIYDPEMQRWPGNQPQTIVICESDLRLVQWKEVGGEPTFRSAEMTTDDAGLPLLIITRSHRQMRQVGQLKTNLGRYTYSLAGDKVVEVGDVEWVFHE